ncbi:SUKH-4 family immunity protein [Nocardia salmonicida]|uniref:SUKH-4 family immunity protein n=1 Tax=Nocardia salmonicida TaxID=53431 RepID=UPI0037B798D7
MPDGADYINAWGLGNYVVFDRNAWIQEFSAPLVAYPDIETLPMELSAVFQVGAGSAGIEAFDRINLDIGDNESIGLIVLGSVPNSDGSMLFGFDIAGGRVILLGLDHGTLELVNSSLAKFVEFLYRFALFIDNDRGISTRPNRARELRSELTSCDPDAFVSIDSWWGVVLSSLSVSGSEPD